MNNFWVSLRCVYGCTNLKSISKYKCSPYYGYMSWFPANIAYQMQGSLYSMTVCDAWSLKSDRGNLRRVEILQISDTHGMD